MMFQKKRVGYLIWAGVMVGVLSHGTWANNKNFKVAVEKSGCASIITSDGVEACRRLSEAKDAACNRPSTCELHRQERWAKEYNVLVAKWPQMSDSDKDRYRREIRELREKLENGRLAATAGATIARECVAARDAIQRYFESTAIPLTEQTRNQLVSERKTLVEKFNETKQKREEAKKKHEEKPNDDSLRREWKTARDANVEAGRKLDEFDNGYGLDIWDNAEKLIRHYKDEKTKHETPTRETTNRRDTCDKTVAVNYESLPSGI